MGFHIWPYSHNRRSAPISVQFMGRSTRWSEKISSWNISAIFIMSWFIIARRYRWSRDLVINFLTFVLKNKLDGIVVQQHDVTQHKGVKRHTVLFVVRSSGHNSYFFIMAVRMAVVYSRTRKQKTGCPVCAGQEENKVSFFIGEIKHNDTILSILVALYYNLSTVTTRLKSCAEERTAEHLWNAPTAVRGSTSLRFLSVWQPS